jgi:hypothetical protein
MNQVNDEEETEILRLKGKAENFTSLHPLQSEMSQVFKFSKAPVDTKNLKQVVESVKAVFKIKSLFIKQALIQC